MAKENIKRSPRVETAFTCFAFSGNPDHADAYVFRFVFTFFFFFFHLRPTLGRYKQAARISTLFNDVSGTSHKALHACYAGQHRKSLCAYPSDEEGEQGEREKKENEHYRFSSLTITNSKTEDDEEHREKKCTTLHVRIVHPGTRNALSQALGRYIRVNMP